MRGALLASLALITLTACQPTGEMDGKPAPSGQISTSAELQGVYRLAGINGAEPKGAEGIAIEITQDRIDVVDNCVLLPWSYHFEGARLVTETIMGPTCRRSYTEDERAIMKAFDGAQTVSRTASNGLLIDGEGGTVTLFSQ